MPKKTFTQGDTRWFLEARFGLFIHWGAYALAARHEWVKNAEKITTADYQKYFDHFYPDLYDPKEWARLARQAGMKYFVITTKHHEGFCLWDTKHTKYKSTKTPWGKDLLKPMIEAFRAEGLRVGFYYSLIDWHHPEFTVDRHHPQRDSRKARALNKDRDMKKYAAYMRKQVTELLTQFGPVDIMWYDFSYPGKDGKSYEDWESEKLLALTRKLQPGILVNNRLGLWDKGFDGDFETPEQFQPSEPLVDKNGKPRIWEACQTFSGSWGYHRDETLWKSLPQLLYLLIDGVSKNGNLLLNVGPTARGEFDYRARERLEGMGQWMRVHNQAIYGCGAAPKEFPAPPDCRYTYNPKTKRLYLHLLVWPFKHLYLEGLAGKIEYAQFLHDASEVTCHEPAQKALYDADAKKSAQCLRLDLPPLKPPTEIPVIELFLK